MRGPEGWPLLRGVGTCPPPGSSPEAVIPPPTGPLISQPQPSRQPIVSGRKGSERGGGVSSEAPAVRPPPGEPRPAPPLPAFPPPWSPRPSRVSRPRRLGGNSGPVWGGSSTWSSVGKALHCVQRERKCINCRGRRTLGRTSQDEARNGDHFLPLPFASSFLSLLEQFPPKAVSWGRARGHPGIGWGSPTA